MPKNSPLKNYAILAGKMIQPPLVEANKALLGKKGSDYKNLHPQSFLMSHRAPSQSLCHYFASVAKFYLEKFEKKPFKLFWGL